MRGGCSTLMCEIVGWIGAGGQSFNVHPSAASALCCCCNGHPHTALMLMLGSSNRRCNRTWGRLSASAREVRGSRKMQCALLPRLPNQQYYLSMARACGSKGCPHGVGSLCFFLGATKYSSTSTLAVLVRTRVYTVSRDCVNEAFPHDTNCCPVLLRSSVLRRRRCCDSRVGRNGRRDGRRRCTVSRATDAWAPARRSPPSSRRECYLADSRCRRYVSSIR